MASTQVRPGQISPIPLDLASGEVSGVLPQANGGTGAATLDQSLVPDVVTQTSTTSLTLSTSTTMYEFTGSAATTWTLPAVSGNTGERFTLANRGTAVVTISRAGSDNIYGATSGTITSYTLVVGTAVDLLCDGTYWVVLTEVQPWTTKWASRNPGAHIIPNAFISYYDKANTAYASLPTVMDTGQPISYLKNRATASAEATIVSGALQMPRGVDGHIDESTYINLDAGSGNTLTRIGTKFRFGSSGSTVGSSIGLTIMNGATLGAGGTAFRIGIHLSVQYNQYVLDKATNATGTLVFTTISTGPLQNNLEWNDVTEYTCELWRNGNTAIAILPDGQRISVTDTDIGAWSTQYGYFQEYMLFGDTDVQPAITEAWYGINSQFPPGDTGLVKRDDIIWERSYATTLTNKTISGASNTLTTQNADLPNGLNNGNTARQSQVTATNTSYYITNSNINLPATLKTGMVVGTKFVWRVAMDKTAAGTGTFSIVIFRGTNGTSADTADVTQTIGTQTAAVDSMFVDVTVTVTTTGATGAYYWSIIPVNKAITATGFGVATGTTGYFSGTVSSVALNTASLKFGIGFRNGTPGTPTVTVPMVQAQAFNLV